VDTTFVRTGPNGAKSSAGFSVRIQGSNDLIYEGDAIKLRITFEWMTAGPIDMVVDATHSLAKHKLTEGQRAEITERVVAAMAFLGYKVEVN
jgi:hypothetical protein